MIHCNLGREPIGSDARDDRDAIILRIYDYC
jgi:hypothetical protein